MNAPMADLIRHAQKSKSKKAIRLVNVWKNDEGKVIVHSMSYANTHSPALADAIAWNKSDAKNHASYTGVEHIVFNNDTQEVVSHWVA